MKVIISISGNVFCQMIVIQMAIRNLSYVWYGDLFTCILCLNALFSTDLLKCVIIEALFIQM
jgi:hypothetical protein